MNIVIIGAGGFLARSIRTGLHHHHFQLLSSNPERVKGEQIHAYSWPQQTLSDPQYIPIWQLADVIIYAAGAGIQSGENASDEVIDHLNCHEPAQLAALLKEIQFKGQFITFGSYFEIGNTAQTQLLSEEEFLLQDHPLPNQYCRAKKKLTKIHHQEHTSGLPYKWLHLILTNIYGPGENENRLIPYIIREVAAGHPLHFTSGSQVRQYTFISDVVAAIEILMGKAAGMFHLTCETCYTVRSIIEECLQQAEQHTGEIPSFDFDIPERRDTGMKFLGLSAARLQKEWQINCSTDIQKGIAQYFS